MAHKNHPDCEYTSIRACNEAARERLGHCVEMTGAGEECTNWAIDLANDRGYCGQHLSSVLLREDRERRAVRKKAELDDRIAEFLAWRDEHPSVHDRIPR